MLINGKITFVRFEDMRFWVFGSVIFDDDCGWVGGGTKNKVNKGKVSEKYVTAIAHSKRQVT